MKEYGKYQTEAEIELAVANWAGIRANLIVPNVSWGLNLHECDLLIMTNSGYCTEVEIKTTLTDLKRDAQKRHGHKSERIKYLYYAIPAKLAKLSVFEFIPERAGVLTISTTGIVFELVKPAKNEDARALREDERYTLARLGAMRVWPLKERVRELKDGIIEIKKRREINENQREQI
jgi:hypothetical protein